MATAQQDILNQNSKVTVIGAGVIGASWAALFLAHGLAVVVNDPRSDVETIVHDYIRNNLSTLNELGLPTDNLEKKLSFEADLERSVAGADLVQENGPERIEFKQDLWARIGKVVGRHALLLSSSCSVRVSTRPGRTWRRSIWMRPRRTRSSRRLRRPLPRNLLSSSKVNATPSSWRSSARSRPCRQANSVAAIASSRPEPKARS